VVARIKKLGLEEMKNKLRVIGLLVAFTRQLDVQMVSDLQIPKFIDTFRQLAVNNVMTH
jgi:pyruvate,water dikinase